MANTVSILGYANTFGDWVVATNAGSNEINYIGKSNWTKDSGTLTLSGSPTSLLVSRDAIFQGQMQVSGTGSSAYIQSNLTVDKQIYFSNTQQSLSANGIITSNGTIFASNVGTGLSVSNNALIGGTLGVTGAVSLSNTIIISGAGTFSNTVNVVGNTLLSNILTVTGNTFLSNNLSVTGNTLISNNLTVSKDTILQGYANIGGYQIVQGAIAGWTTLNIYGNATVNYLQSNTSVNTNNLSVVNTTYTKDLQANTSANTTTLSVVGTGFVKVLEANSAVNTSTLSVVNTTHTKNLEANTYANTTTLSVVGTAFVDKLQANTHANTSTLSVVNTTYTKNLEANTYANTSMLSVVNTTYTKNLEANTYANTSTLSVVNTTYTKNLEANTYANTTTLSVVGTGFVKVLEANSAVNTTTLSVVGTGYVKVLEANSAVNTTTLSATGTGFVKVLEANSAVNTTTLSATGTGFVKVLEANSVVNTTTLSATGTGFVKVLEANSAVNTTTLSVVGTGFVKVLEANSVVNTTTMSATGTGFVKVLEANSAVNTTTISATGTGYVKVLEANSSVNTTTLSVVNTTYTNNLEANTYANTTTLSVVGTAYANVVQANLVVNTSTLSVNNTTYTNVLQANLVVNTSTLSVNNTTYTNNLQANSVINTTTISISSNAYANSVVANLAVNTASLHVEGKSVLKGQANTTNDLGVGANVYVTNTGSFGNITVANGAIIATINILPYTAAAFTHANSAYGLANVLNSLPVFAQSAFDKANTAAGDIVIIQGVDTTQNTNITTTTNNATAAFKQANLAFDKANTAANDITTIQGVDTTQNTIITSAQSFANGAFLAANSGASFANGAFLVANSGASFANGAFITANSGASFANSAFTKANNIANGTQTLDKATITNALDMAGTSSSANIYSLVVGSGGLNVIGNYTIQGVTIYNPSSFIISAATPVTGSSTASYGVFRTANGAANGAAANSYIRWNESTSRWDATANNLVGTYYNLLWANDITDSTSTTSSTQVASATAVKSAYDRGTSALNASNISSGTLPSARLSGAYGSITGVGTLASGSIPTSLITGLATVATSGAYSDLSGRPSLATVATSGSYSDLSNKPTVPGVAWTDYASIAVGDIFIGYSQSSVAVGNTITTTNSVNNSAPSKFFPVQTYGHEPIVAMCRQYTAGRFLAMTKSGALYTSTNGWDFSNGFSTYYSDARGVDFTCITGRPGTNDIVMMGKNGYYQYSLGSSFPNWSSGAFTGVSSINAITFSAILNKYIAVGTSTSGDGVVYSSYSATVASIWALELTVTGKPLYVVVSNATICYVAGEGGTIYSATTATGGNTPTTWTQNTVGGTTPIDTTSNFRSCMINNSYGVTIIANNSSPSLSKSYFNYSNNAIGWSTASEPPGTTFAAFAPDQPSGQSPMRIMGSSSTLYYDGNPLYPVQAMTDANLNGAFSWYDSSSTLTHTFVFGDHGTILRNLPNYGIFSMGSSSPAPAGTYRSLGLINPKVQAHMFIRTA